MLFELKENLPGFDSQLAPSSLKDFRFDCLVSILKTLKVEDERQKLNILCKKLLIIQKKSYFEEKIDIISIDLIRTQFIDAMIAALLSMVAYHLKVTFCKDFKTFANTNV